ncbi:MAG: hypothetical protein IKJ67_11185 [Bacteroidales bacterium]|nr:hypothetical protein [Bacteroidales bacterium]
MKKILILFFLLLSVGGVVKAQDMSVGLFEFLERDMSARMAKVRDVNSDLCALLKIETVEKGFEFSGCIIEKTEQKTGEIWVFVSPGVRFITIKHPKFGVLRNYNFPQSIQSGCVYQMRLLTKKEEKMDSTDITKIVDARLEELLAKRLAELEAAQKQQLQQQAQQQQTEKDKEKKEKEEKKKAEKQQKKKEKKVKEKEVRDNKTFVMLNASQWPQNDLSLGFTVGRMYNRIGWYASVASNFKFEALKADYITSIYGQDGSVFIESGEGHLDDIYDHSHLSATAGVMIKVFEPMSLKLGVGYGCRYYAATIDRLVMDENIRQKYQDYGLIALDEYSARGLELSAGLNFIIGKVALSVDALLLDNETIDFRFGIGYSF